MLRCTPSSYSVTIAVVPPIFVKMSWEDVASYPLIRDATFTYFNAPVCEARENDD